MMDSLLLLGRSLLESQDGLRWPEERIQIQYTGTSGNRLLEQAVDFLCLLEQKTDVLRSQTWRGLDYGVGWGRMATLMTYFGRPDQLDCVDAWGKSLEIARNCGLENSLSLVSATVRPGELGEGIYDFVYAYSVFTHLPDTHILNNAREIMRSIKPNGTFLFTVRQPNFLDFLKKNGKYNPVVDRLDAEGYWFGNAQSGDYGDTVVSQDWLFKNLGDLGDLQWLGPMTYESTQIAVSIKKHS